MTTLEARCHASVSLDSSEPLVGPGVGDTSVGDAISLYRSTMDEVVRDGSLRIAFGFSQGRHFGPSGRTVLSSRRHPGLVRRIEEECAIEGPSLGAVVFDGLFVDMAEREDLDMREVVANDLARIVSDDVGLTGTGPVRRLLPWLVNVAASIVFFGRGKASADHAGNVVSLFVSAMAKDEYGSVNAIGKLSDDHPDFQYIVDTVAHEASRRTSVDGRQTFEQVCIASRRSVVEALSSMGVVVTAT